MVSYLDLHCDTLTAGWQFLKKDIGEFPEAQVDVKRLLSGGCLGQFFTIYMIPLTMKRNMGKAFPSDQKHIDVIHGIFQNTLLRYSDSIAFAGNREDMKRNTRAKKVSAFLSLEDGRAIDGRASNVKKFHKMGVRMITLTWNLPNCLGVPSSLEKDIMDRGLSKLGKDVVVEMNHQGILVDVSHLSDGGFWDVHDISEKPFVASHSNARELSPHVRNLSDDMLKALAEKGGVVGMNFDPALLHDNPKDKNNSYELIFAQMRHVMKVAGLEAVAIGSDFDHFEGEEKLEVNGAENMPTFFEKMEEAGFTAKEIEKISSQNLERVIGDSMK